ncbi:hypothetical protein K461DRAFT_282600 [Myriangium duriaei CBS 260.36]|uniref:Uncharacterized protein n=1 Tax=Myriangium duriaei CBS 260.36 TaxID=1168546 RepID=A0A9P4MCV0_9PEZI|nr:hypothetical protein K461DRAFT_282600 [Myriangium duriaei CBS 260.36]
MSSPTPPSPDARGRVNGRPVLTSIDMLHIRWKVFGPLSESLEIASDARDPCSDCRPYTNNDPLVRRPASEPPVSSLKVELDGIQETVSYFLQAHNGDEHGEWTRASAPTDQELADARDGRFTWGDDEQGNILVRCCGVRRPHVPPWLTVSASDRPYVTIRDYVDAIHAWLRSYKDDILYARSFWTDNPLPADTNFYIVTLRPTKVYLKDGEREASEAVASYTRGAGMREWVERYMRERDAA